MPGDTWVGAVSAKRKSRKRSVPNRGPRRGRVGLKPPRISGSTPSGMERSSRPSEFARFSWTRLRRLWSSRCIRTFSEQERELMKIRYDAEVDALSIIFRDTTVTTEELAEGIAGEYD